LPAAGTVVPVGVPVLGVVVVGFEVVGVVVGAVVADPGLYLNHRWNFLKSIFKAWHLQALGIIVIKLLAAGP
jgi:hypothetical protein